MSSSIRSPPRRWCSIRTRKTSARSSIDMGGGTTDYIVYVDGAVKASGCARHRRRSHHERSLARPAHPDGPRGEAEGRGGQRDPRRMRARRDGGAQGRDRFCGQGSRARDAEHHHPLPRARDLRAAQDASWSRWASLRYLGAGVLLTGGCSLLRGIDQLAEEVFATARASHPRAARSRASPPPSKIRSFPPRSASSSTRTPCSRIARRGCSRAWRAASVSLAWPPRCSSAVDIWPGAIVCPRRTATRNSRHLQQSQILNRKPQILSP